MTENEWVKTHTTGPFKDYDPDVVAFIGEILYDGRIPAGEPGSVKNNGSVCRDSGREIKEDSMQTIEIYKNYGVLGAEKRTVYTFSAEHPHATYHDKIKVVVPDGWTIYQNQMRQMMITSPWGWNYNVDELLTNINGRAAFRGMDRNMRYKTAFLFTPEELKEKAEKERKRAERKAKKEVGIPSSHPG